MYSKIYSLNYLIIISLQISFIFNSNHVNTKDINKNWYSNNYFKNILFKKNDNLENTIDYDKITFKPTLTTTSKPLINEKPSYFKEKKSSFQLYSPILYTTQNSLKISSYHNLSTVQPKFLKKFELFNSTYTKENHHFYHQAYLLYKYYYLFKNKLNKEIEWFKIPEDIRDKFRMLISTIKLTHNNKLKEDDNFIISKALEIVKWNGWVKLNKSKLLKKNLEAKKDVDSKEFTTTIKNIEKSDVFEKSDNFENEYKTLPSETILYKKKEFNKIDDQLEELTTLDSIKLSSTYTTMSTNEALKKAFENIEDIRVNHGCSKPKGRLISLKALSFENRFYLPKFVYLHKCDNEAGCCNNSKDNCVAMEQNIIFKYFYNLSPEKEQNRVVRLEFVNDTRCECRELDNSKKVLLNKNDLIEKFLNKTNYWNKKFDGKLKIKNFFECENLTLNCPHPYSIIHNNKINLCYCGCKPNNIFCIKIMNGLKRLDDKQINCIRVNKCFEPECLYKNDEINYNKNTGYCPDKETLNYI